MTSNRILSELERFTRNYNPKNQQYLVEFMGGDFKNATLSLRIAEGGSLFVDAQWGSSPSYSTYKRSKKKFRRRRGFSQKSLENLSVDIYKFFLKIHNEIIMIEPLHDMIERELSQDQAVQLDEEATKQGLCTEYEKMTQKDVDTIFKIKEELFSPQAKLQLINFFSEKDVKKVFEKLGYDQAQKITYCPKDDANLPFLIAQKFFAEGLAIKIMTRPTDGVVLVMMDSRNFTHPNNRVSKTKSKKTKQVTKEKKAPKKVPKKATVHSWQRKEKRYTTEEVLNKVHGTSKNMDKSLLRADFDGNNMNVTSLRLRTFKAKGCVCAGCGIEGKFFIKCRHRPDEQWHFNLYAEVDEELIMMTKDHIMPRSKGGRNTLNNMQPMCLICNQEKADKIPEHLKGEVQ